MSQTQFFSAGKIPTFLDKIEHRVETRKDREVKVLDLHCRIFPFTAQIASALPSDAAVKRTLFSVNNGDPVSHLKATAFNFGLPRQVVKVFASVDTEDASIAFDQAAVKNLRAKLDRTSNTWALLFTLSFGPVGKDEAEYAIGWHTTQRALSYDEAEPTLDFEEDGDDEKDDAPAERPAPMWEDDQPRSAAADTSKKAAKAPKKTKPGTERAYRKTHSHVTKTRKRGR